MWRCWRSWRKNLKLKIQIDQSGKIEETQRDTIIAFSNGTSYAVKITAKTKRKLQDVFRGIGEPKTFVVHTFCIFIYFAIKDHCQSIDTISIDQEYFGKEKAITNTLKIIFEIESLKLPEIIFTNVGKQSKAHKKAINIFRKKQDPDKVISYNEIEKTMFIIKNRRPVLKHRR